MSLKARAALWLLSGVAGAVLFWLIQVLTGGPTITDFMGAQIVAAGGYPQGLATAVGWAVHVGVALAYAFLFVVVAWPLGLLGRATGLLGSLVAALLLGWVTSVIAPPAISVTISLLGLQGWPKEQLFPINTEVGLPFWNHLAFFGLNWLIQSLRPALARR